MLNRDGLKANMKMLLRRALITGLYAPQAVRNRVGGRGKGGRPGPERPDYGREANSEIGIEIERIVVIRPDHLGDLLFATPALQVLREAFPSAHITGLVGPWGRAMWADNPSLDALGVVHFPGISGGQRDAGRGPLWPYILLGVVGRRLARHGYDLGIVLRFDHWWGAAALWTAGTPNRWGYATPGMSWWLTHPVKYVPGRHEVEQNLRLVEAVVRRLAPGSVRGPLDINRREGRPPLRPPRPTVPPQALVERMASWLAAPRRVVIHPGTGAANKLWTVAGWAQVAARLAFEGWAIAITGSPSEQELAQAIESAYMDALAREIATIDVDRLRTASTHRFAVCNLAGHTDELGQLVWILEQAHLVLGVDSGPLHIASALGKPTLHLHGPSDEAVWGPWGDPRLHRVVRAPGTLPTGRLDVGSHALEGGPQMRAITPDMVMAALDDMLLQMGRLHQAL